MALLPMAATGQEDVWTGLQDRAIDYYQAKEHEKAVETQQKALEVAEKTFGPEDLKVAESLDNLAIYSQATGDNKGAERYYRKAIAIMEKKLPPNDQYLAIFIDYVGSFLVKIGKKEEGAKLKERASRIRLMNKGKRGR